MKYKDISEISGIELKFEFDDIVKDFANKTVKELKNVSPRGTRTKKNYRRGWTYDFKKKKGKKIDEDAQALVFNKTNWPLTWLLEKGHLIVNKKGGVGWAAPRKHIKPTYDAEKSKFIAEMKKAAINNLKLEIK